MEGSLSAHQNDFGLSPAAGAEFRGFSDESEGKSAQASEVSPPGEVDQ